MALDKPYLDIPGITVFDTAQDAKGVPPRGRSGGIRPRAGRTMSAGAGLIPIRREAP